jgi:hypothetical protein
METPMSEQERTEKPGVGLLPPGYTAAVGDDIQRLRRVWRKLAAIAEALESDEETSERHRDEIRQIRHCSWVCYDIVGAKAAV